MNWIKKLIGWCGRFGSHVLVALPRSWRYALGDLLGVLWFDVFRIRRDLVIHNLNLCFPEMSAKDKVHLGRASLKNLGRNFVEYAYLPVLNKKNYLKVFEFENLEVLDEALAKKKGVLMLTLHLGHGDLACAGLSLQGYTMYMVSKFFKLKWLNDLWFGMRQKLGTHFIPPRDSSYALLRALKNQATVIIPLDQYMGPPVGVRTTFFGIETGTAAGLAVMAHRSLAPVVLAYTVRQANGKHLVRIVKEIPVVFSENRDESLARVTQSFNDELEKLVRMCPEQWMWIHKRWKKFAAVRN